MNGGRERAAFPRIDRSFLSHTFCACSEDRLQLEDGRTSERNNDLWIQILTNIIGWDHPLAMDRESLFQRETKKKMRREKRTLGKVLMRKG